MEVFDELSVQKFARLFRGYTYRYGTFEIPAGQPSGKQKGTAKTVAGPITYENYAEHLRGKKSVGIIPLIDDNESACFGCIDIDKYPMDFNKLTKDCEYLPVTITKSKSGGAHVWLFTKDPVPAQLLQNVLRLWASELGFGKSEIFPKQIKRLSSEDTGNWINLPYYGETRVAYIRGEERSLTEFLVYVEDGRLMNEATLSQFLKKDAEKPLFHDGPPCLAKLAEKGLTSGSRNMVLLNVGSYYKKKDPSNFVQHIMEFNKNYVEEPLPESEILHTIAKSLQRKSYPYQCNMEPLCSACNRAACLKREYGVGGSAEELEIMLTGLTKIATDPPIWYINIDGVRVEMSHIDVLIKQGEFRTLVAETVHILFSTIKKSAWEKVVKELLDTVEVIQAPAESSLRGQINETFRDFIQVCSQEDSMEHLMAHTVFVDRVKERAYFRPFDLMKRMKRDLGQIVDGKKVWAFLHSSPTYGVEAEEADIPGAGPTKMWSVNIQHLYIPTSYVASPTVLQTRKTDSPF